MNKFFTQKDIDEIIDMIELSTNSSIDEKHISCFPMLHSLALGNSTLSDYSESDIKDAIKQVTLEKDFFQSIGNFDCYLFDKILEFLK